MITEIGIAAGDVWHYLDAHQNQKSKLKDVAKGIDKPRELALMSIGWLAREGHAIVEQSGNDYQVWLRK
ncbi:MAG: winged helix-turn-helix domain-containing protein [Candidatus Omnitrophica bacterium]|nr:winged helix-turn-helix domain-containing protein [Candidatus Omnitrophota bacterium]